MSKKLFCLLIFFIFSGDAKGQDWENAANYLFNKPASAVYFYWTGIVKKPYPVIFISDSSPSRRVLKRISFRLEEPDCEPVMCSKSEMNEITKNLKDSLASKKINFEDPQNRHVVLGIVENENLNLYFLTGKQAATLMQIVQGVIGEKYKKLNDLILNFRYRIGGELTNDKKKELHIYSTPLIVPGKSGDKE